MRKIDYTKIIKKAFSQTWKYKFLWWFGFFIVISNFIVNVSVNADTEKAKTISEIYSKLNFAAWSAIISAILLLFVLKVLSKIAIIKAIDNIGLYKQIGTGKSLKGAYDYFWRIIAMEIILFVFTVLVVFAVFIPVIFLAYTKSYVMLAFLVLVASLLILSLFILVSFVKKFSYYYVVLGNLKIKYAIEKAYELFAKTIKNNLLMGLIVIGLEIAVYSGIAFALFGSFAIILLFGFAVAFLPNIYLIVYIIFAGISLVSLLIFLLSVYETFKQTIWLFYFKEITLINKINKSNQEIIPALPDPQLV